MLKQTTKKQTKKQTPTNRQTDKAETSLISASVPTISFFLCSRSLNLNRILSFPHSNFLDIVFLGPHSFLFYTSPSVSLILVIYLVAPFLPLPSSQFPSLLPLCLWCILHRRFFPCSFSSVSPPLSHSLFTSNPSALLSPLILLVSVSRPLRLPYRHLLSSSDSLSLLFLCHFLVTIFCKYSDAIPP